MFQELEKVVYFRFFKLVIWNYNNKSSYKNVNVVAFFKNENKAITFFNIFSKENR